ncbi:LysE/ArgO family amino acid transporter [Aeromicrobium terrae]|uniref:Amino acid transporter n=1 Tax=Aeromicrobium terrae TaxID=2498846 RepID=A0A5C8NJ34_9ACTN|nr:LysE family transporter [Aeromicrobium terrae]TXL60895.1 amino acid transporter [Aeromicrobium terrae]
MVASLLAGLGTGLGLIVAIGAQNAYVLRQGIMRAHVLAVVAVCAVSDVVLIAAGVSGVGAAVDRAGVLLDVVRWLGVAFLLWYAAQALRRARQSEALSTNGGPAESRRTVVGRAVALTWLNPHVYLDTVLLLGSIAATHDDVAGGRWWFALGAAVGSIVWFTGLGFGARLLAPALTRPRAWQVLEVCIAATMIAVALQLAVG